MYRTSTENLQLHIIFFVSLHNSTRTKCNLDSVLDKFIHLIAYLPFPGKKRRLVQFLDATESFSKFSLESGLILSSMIKVHDNNYWRFVQFPCDSSETSPRGRTPSTFNVKWSLIFFLLSENNEVIRYNILHGMHAVLYSAANGAVG